MHDVHDVVIDRSRKTFSKVYRNSQHSGEMHVDRPRQRSWRCARNTQCYMREQFQRACVCRFIIVSKRREKGREREKKKRGVGYTTAVSPRGIRVLDSHPRLRPSSPLFSSPPSPSICLFSPLSLHLPSGSSFDRESRQSCVPWLTRGAKGGEGGNPRGIMGETMASP